MGNFHLVLQRSQLDFLVKPGLFYNEVASRDNTSKLFEKHDFFQVIFQHLNTSNFYPSQKPNITLYRRYQRANAYQNLTI